MTSGLQRYFGELRSSVRSQRVGTVFLRKGEISLDIEFVEVAHALWCVVGRSIESRRKPKLRVSLGQPEMMR